MRIDIGLATDGPLRAADRARELAALGVDGLFTFENAHDVFLPLALATTAADVDLMTNVAIAFPRSPLHLAYAANDLQLLSRGRFRLGLGSQVRAHIEKRYGARWEQPVAQMREWVRAVKTILGHFAGDGAMDFRGRWTTHTLMTPAFDPGPNPYGPPPVLVGALGPRMCEMAGEVADGVLVMPFNSARHLQERTLPAIDRGLAASSRTRGEFEIVAEVICAVGRTDEELARAAQAARSQLAFYGSTPAYRSVLEASGWGDLQPELNRRSKNGDWAGMASMIHDQALHTLAAVGTPEEVAEVVVARFGAVADRACLYFPGYSISDRLIGETVAAVRSATAGGAPPA